MDETFNAIVLRVVKYNDKIQIADVLTEGHGRMGFAVPAGKYQKKNSKAYTLWRPLNMLEFECNINKGKGLPRPKDVRSIYNYKDMPYNPIKTMLAMFVDELLCGSLWGEVNDPYLFAYVENSLKTLDLMERQFVNFHIAFSIGLLTFLGISPNTERRPFDRFFDLRLSEFTDTIPSHPDYLQSMELDALVNLSRMNYANMRFFRFSRSDRQRVLEMINKYFMIHVPDFKPMKSMDIFKEALS